VREFRFPATQPLDHADAANFDQILGIMPNKAVESRAHVRGSIRQDTRELIRPPILERSRGRDKREIVASECADMLAWAPTIKLRPNQRDRQHVQS